MTEVPLPKVESITWDHTEPGRDGLELEIWASPLTMIFHLGYDELDVRPPGGPMNEPRWYGIHPFERYRHDCRMTILDRLVELGCIEQEFADKLMPKENPL